MEKWMPIYGSFIVNNEEIIFEGKNLIDDFGNSQGQVGILLSDRRMLSGKISMDIEFETEELEYGEEAEIIFDYYDEYRFKCAGITGNQMKYEAKKYEGTKWEWLRHNGDIPRLPQKKIRIDLEVESSFLRMLINEVEVFRVFSNEPFQKTQVGIWTRSKRKIVFRIRSIDARRPEAFVITQFGGIFDQIYDTVIKPVCEKKDIKPVRADEISGSYVILSDIIRSLQSASIIIADITPNNPNVFYELGYAHAIGKRVILLCEKAERAKLPFDISGYRTIFYDNTIVGKEQIEKTLEQYINEMLV